MWSSKKIEYIVLRSLYGISDVTQYHDDTYMCVMLVYCVCTGRLILCAYVQGIYCNA